MHNKHFIAFDLDHTHLEYYKQAVLNCHAQYVQKSTATAKQIAEWSIEDAQALMRAMGYANEEENDDD